MSDWRVIVPEATTNYVLNPSAETTGNYTAEAGTTVDRSTTYQKYGLYSYRIQSDADDEGVELTLSALTNAIHTVTMRVRGTLPAAWDWSLDDATWHTPTLEEAIDANWDLYSAEIPAAQANGSTKLSIHQNGAGSGDFYIDGVQVEPTEDYYTTYCDGTQEGCAWNGAEHASTSTRSAVSRAGGRLYDLQDDYSLDIGGVTGAGAAQVRLTDDPYAMLPGGQLNSAKIQSRTFSLSGVIRGSSDANLNAKRQALIELFAHDAYPKDENGWQPIRLRYIGAATQKQISAHYEGGLELDIRATEVCFWERVTVRFFAPDPFWYELGDSAALLDSNDTATLRYITGRRWDTGTWDDLGLTNNPAAGGSDVVIVGPDGLVYVGGDFTNWNNVVGRDRIAAYDPVTDTWSNVGGASDFADGQIRALAFGPDGTLYAGGSFTTGGGSPADYIAQWNGAAWAALGNPDQGAAAITTVLAIVIDRIGDIYIGGDFLNWSDIGDADMLAMWDTSAGSYSAVEAGASAYVNTLCVAMNNDLYIGGNFTNWGDANGDYIVKWDGTNLSSLSTGADDLVASIVQADDGIIYIGGSFTTIGGVSAARVAAYNGTAFSALAGGITNNTVSDLAIGPDGSLWAVGSFTTMGDLGAVEPRAIWNGSSWAVTDLNVSGGHTHSKLAIGRGDPVNINNYDVWIQLNNIPTAYFPGTTTVTNDGTNSAFPRIKVSRSGGTSAQLLSIQNVTTGKMLLFDYDLQDGETLTIDLSPTRKSIISDFYGLRMDALLARSSFGTFALLPGTNTATAMVAVAGAPTVAAWMEWQDTYRSLD